MKIKVNIKHLSTFYSMELFQSNHQKLQKAISENPRLDLKQEDDYYDAFKIVPLFFPDNQDLNMKRHFCQHALCHSNNRRNFTGCEV